jgi:surface antigen
MSKIGIVVLSLSALLTACNSVNNEDVGLLSGGAVGGLLGSQFGSGAGKVAAVAGGVLVGAFLGGKIGKYMDKQDKLEMQHALETAPVGRSVAWKNPDNGNQYKVQPTRTYYVKGDPCREYTTYATIAGKSEKIYGKACRQPDGSWRAAN